MGVKSWSRAVTSGNLESFGHDMPNRGVCYQANGRDYQTEREQDKNMSPKTYTPPDKEPKNSPLRSGRPAKREIMKLVHPQKLQSPDHVFQILSCQCWAKREDAENKQHPK